MFWTVQMTLTNSNFKFNSEPPNKPLRKKFDQVVDFFWNRKYPFLLFRSSLNFYLKKEILGTSWRRGGCFSFWSVILANYSYHLSSK